MSPLLSILATGVLIALGLWLLGSTVLRVGGVALAVGGLLSTAITGSPAMAVASILGALGWLAGHWLFAVSHHHYFYSPLARRVFHEALPRQLDPTRGAGGYPHVPPEHR
jgi:hypothetical protein